jgi:hypothetical protein
LKHPWITRINKTLIPLTIPDKMDRLEIENKLRRSMTVLFFNSIVNKKEDLENKSLVEYKRLLEKVSDKIEKWH